MNTITEKLRDSVRPELKAALTVWLSHQQILLDMERKHLLPDAAKREIERLERADAPFRNGDELLERAQELNALRAVAANASVQAEAVRACNNAYFAMREPLHALCDACDKALTAQHAAFVELETEFFKSHGFTHEPTQISRQIATEKAKIAAARHSYDASAESVARTPGNGYTPSCQFTQHFGNLLESNA